MGLPHVMSFCWCWGLEMGSKIIGFMHLAFSIALVVISSIFAESVRSYVGTVEDAEDQLYTHWYKIAVITAVLTSLHVLLALSLIYSVFKRATWGLRAWVWIMGVLCTAAILFILLEMLVYGTSEPGIGSEIFVSFLEGALFFGAIIYCILCVYSYYLMLRSAEEMEGPNKTMY